MGKGSGRRPLLTSNEQLEKNWDLIFGKKKSNEKHLMDSVKDNEQLYKDLSRIDTIGQNGNDGLHYEYELNKSSGEVEKRFLNGISKPNEEQFNGRQKSNTVNTSKTSEGTVSTSSDSGKVE